MLVLDPALMKQCIYDVGGHRERFEDLHEKVLKFPEGCRNRPAIRSLIAHNRHAFMRAYLMNWAPKGKYDLYMRKAPSSPNWGCDPEILDRFFGGLQQNQGPAT